MVRLPCSAVPLDNLLGGAYHPQHTNTDARLQHYKKMLLYFLRFASRLSYKSLFVL
jgi:hypothetical protein